MNVGGSSTNISVTLNGSSGGPGCAGGSWQDAYSNVPAGEMRYSSALGANGCLGTLVVTSSSQPVVGMVAESFSSFAAAGTHSATLYDLVPSQAVTTKVMFPIYKKRRSTAGGGYSAQSIVGVIREASYYLVPNPPAYHYCCSQTPYACPDRADYEGFDVP